MLTDSDVVRSTSYSKDVYEREKEREARRRRRASKRFTGVVMARKTRKQQGQREEGGKERGKE